MRTRLMHVFPETALERVLEALERELIEATDADILEAANDLGMKPGMKGSAAFVGLRHAGAPPRPEDFFDAKSMLRLLNDPRRSWSAGVALPAQAARSAATPRAVPRMRPAGRKSRAAKEPGES